MIARMNTRAKNHAFFLQAAASLRERFPRVEFVLVGDGPLRSELERQAEGLRLAGQVHFIGDQRDIPAILASLDISVLPSASESLSNAILESMAAGVAVVASRVGGNPELVNHDRGILFAPDSVEELAAAIEKLLLDQDQRVSLGRNSRRFAQANFTVEEMGKRYEELYTKLLARKHWQPNSRHVVPAAEKSDPTRVAIVAASLRYVGGQSVQADLLLRHWKHADVAHIFSASYWSFLIAPAPALWIARLRGKKVIIHYHSGEARNHLRRFRSARAILPKADRLVVPSGYLVKVFQEFGVEAEAIPNIVDVSQFSFRERRPLRPHLICTRGFHPYYSVDVVVRAFAEVQKQFPKARLDLVGRGPSENEIRALVRDLNLAGVRFLGVASREEIGPLYDQADIFINASWLDNMPVSILEAFACGTPVISTAAESIPYLVEHERTGLLSEVGDPQALAQNVIRLLRDPELAARLASQAYDESQSYRWSAVRQQWRDLYRSLACPRGEVVQDLTAIR